MAALDIGLCIAAIYCISFVLLGFDFYAAFLIDLTILFIIIDMFGLMYLWNIPLNAVGLSPGSALHVSLTEIFGIEDEKGLFRAAHADRPS